MIRNDWLVEVSAQQVFDHVVTHSRQQAIRAVYQSVPMMQTPDPRTVKDGFGESRETYVVKQCHAGCLLTEAELFHLQVGGRLTNTWSRLRDLGLVPTRLEPHFSLIDSLQSIHDDPSLWKDREDHFAKLAHALDLQVPVKERT